jgi:hypothetical protein
MVPLVLLEEPGGCYWKALHEFIVQHLLSGALISPEDLNLYRITDSYEEAVQECLQFFQVYHSMRYVKNKIVFRLQKELAPALLDEINVQFADILTDGRFRQRDALSDEQDEPELADLPRLVFHFNRRSLGRLRQLINCINRGRIEPQDFSHGIEKAAIRKAGVRSVDPKAAGVDSGDAMI